MQWMYDNMVAYMRQQDVSGQPVNRTTRGRFLLPNTSKPLPTMKLKICKDDGSVVTGVFYGYELHEVDDDITGDSTLITGDNTTITADR